MRYLSLSVPIVIQGFYYDSKAINCLLLLLYINYLSSKVKKQIMTFLTMDKAMLNAVSQMARCDVIRSKQLEIVAKKGFLLF